MNDRSRLPATIRACVHDGAIDRVSRFFNASVADAAAELIQNSRRSGATRLDVATEDVPEGGTVVTVTDDGFGIADPAVLLSFGESGWDTATTKREDPAGMGVYALSKRGCVISSRPATAGRVPMPGWRVELTPECFIGKQEARIVSCEDAPLPSGTAISFRADQSREGIRAAFIAAARYSPLAVTVNGEAVERKSFLDGALHVERWQGLSFGVFDSRVPGFNNSDLNFHGLTLSVCLPTMDTIDGGTWSVLADVDACPELELVLPARREAVADALPGRDAQGGPGRHLPGPCAEPTPRLRSLTPASPRPGRRASTCRSHRPCCVPGAPASPISTTGATRRTASRSAPTPWSWRSMRRPRTSSASGGQRTGQGSPAACSRPTRAWKATPGTTRWRGWRACASTSPTPALPNPSMHCAPSPSRAPTYPPRRACRTRWRGPMPSTFTLT